MLFLASLVNRSRAILRREFVVCSAYHFFLAGEAFTIDCDNEGGSSGARRTLLNERDWLLNLMSCKYCTRHFANHLVHFWYIRLFPA